MNQENFKKFTLTLHKVLLLKRRAERRLKTKVKLMTCNQRNSKFQRTIFKVDVFFRDNFAVNVLVTAVGRRIKGLLVTHLRVQNDLCKDNPDLDREVNFVLSMVDEVGISAGGYLYFSKAFLLSFYSILATYIAILIQSV